MEIDPLKDRMLAALCETLLPQRQRLPLLPSFIDDFAACELTSPEPLALAAQQTPRAVDGYLPDLIAAMSTKPFGQLLRSYFPELRWYQIFQGDGPAAAVKQGLFAAQLVGNNGLFRTDRLYLGLFFMAPNITYPLHQHAATELYYVLSGSVSIRHGRQAMPKCLGRDEVSITAPHQVHQLQTRTQPCLMAYIWTGDLTPQNWWWQQNEDGSWSRICWLRTAAGDWRVLRREPLSAAEIVRAGDGA